MARKTRSVAFLVVAMFVLVLVPTSASAQYPPQQPPPNSGPQKVCPDLGQFNAKQAAEKKAFNDRLKEKKAEFKSEDHTRQQKRAFKARLRAQRRDFRAGQRAERKAFLEALAACQSTPRNRNDAASSSASVPAQRFVVKVWMVFAAAVVGLALLWARRRRLRSLSG